MRKIEFLAMIDYFWDKCYGRDIIDYDSLKLCLGEFLLNQVSEGEAKIEFDKDVLSFGINNTIREKVDIVICALDGSYKYAIILKYPEGEQYCERMYEIIEDIKFMEQLKFGGFDDACVITMVDDPDFYDGPETDGIYGYFRSKKLIHGDIYKANVEGENTEPLNLVGAYRMEWSDFDEDSKKCVLSYERAKGVFEFQKMMLEMTNNSDEIEETEETEEKEGTDKTRKERRKRWSEEFEEYVYYKKLKHKEKDDDDGTVTSKECRDYADMIVNRLRLLLPKGIYLIDDHLIKTERPYGSYKNESTDRKLPFDDNGEYKPFNDDEMEGIEEIAIWGEETTDDKQEDNHAENVDENATGEAEDVDENATDEPDNVDEDTSSDKRYSIFWNIDEEVEKLFDLLLEAFRYDNGQGEVTVNKKTGEVMWDKMDDENNYVFNRLKIGVLLNKLNDKYPEVWTLDCDDVRAVCKMMGIK